MRFICQVLLGAFFLATLSPASIRAQVCEKPNMMITLDKSGSMATPSGNTKWDQAEAAISYILTTYNQPANPMLNFGFDLFPCVQTPWANGYCGNSSSSPPLPPCGPGVVLRGLGSSTTDIMGAVGANGPQGGTPLAATLLTLNSHLPLKDPNRRNFIMLITDGEEFCAANTDDVVASAADLLENGIMTFVIGFGTGVDAAVLNATAVAGGTGQYYQADNQSELQTVMDDIVSLALVEVCDDRDNDCDSLTDEDWPDKNTVCQISQGGCTANGVMVCNAAQDGTECNAQITIGTEICNDLDDDCDGSTDEDFPSTDGDAYDQCDDCCDLGTEPMTGCSPATAPDIYPGATEVCNGYDDDCDGAIDEDDPAMGDWCGIDSGGESPPYYTDVGTCQHGTMRCVGGVMSCVGEINPVGETCDNRDNDCDGATDENLTTPCSNACGSGDRQCVSGQWGDCSAPLPSIELCDGLDNDCDTLFDEDFPLLGQFCEDGLGECYVTGVYVCSANQLYAVCSVTAPNGVPEFCDGADNDCDGAVDEWYPEMDQDCGICGPGELPPCYLETGDCQPGTWMCLDGALECIGEIEPSPEVCDNRDNDCDTFVDENLQRNCSTICGTGTQDCQNGQWTTCTADLPSQELCDGDDNDCDGDIDEDFPLLGQACTVGLGICENTGVYVCRADGAGVECSVSPHPSQDEICDGLDNNCNGVVDEDDPQLGQNCGEPCDPGEPPPCYTEVGECQPGNWFCLDAVLTCLGEIEPMPEVLCDGLDNDCDGEDDDWAPEICDNGIDDDCDGMIDLFDPDCGAACEPGEQEPCGTNVGDCQEGIRTCQPDGTWGDCIGAVDPVPEVCDGRDNDCDEEIDEDAVPEICDNGIDDDCDGLIDGMDPDCGECTPGETRDCGTDVGECKMGIQTCTASAQWTECVGEIGPQPEMCDGLDNDCDGIVDEGDLCQDYDVCLCGECVSPCSAGECTGGTTCVNDWCVSDPCCGVICPVGETCVEKHCQDMCVVENVQCGADEECRLGICVPVDCLSPGHECPDGQACEMGECVADLCWGVDCGVWEFCRDGVCEAVGCVDCGTDQICDAGQCVDSLCAQIHCESGQVCVDGTCAADPCMGVSCPVGTVCLNGECVGDPCQNIECPPASECQDGACVPVQEEPDAGVTDADGGGTADLDQDAGPDLDGGGQADEDTPDAGGQPDSGSGADQGGGGGGDGCGCLTQAGSGNRGLSVAFLLLLIGLIRFRRV